MQSVSISSRDDYTLALPINSPPGVQGEGINRSIDQSPSDHEDRLLQQRLLHNAPRVLEFRDSLEKYFSLQGVDTLIPSSQGIFGTRREGIPHRRRFWEVARGFYQPSILWFPKPGEKGISSLASSKGQSGRALTRLLSAHFSRISEEIYL